MVLFKLLWHEIWIKYYLSCYNRCPENEQGKKGLLFQKAYHHQEKLHELKYKNRSTKL